MFKSIQQWFSRWTWKKLARKLLKWISTGSKEELEELQDIITNELRTR